MSSRHFRAGVVVLIRRADSGEVLAFERARHSGSWQFPQGGLDVGEAPIDGAWRELREETGLGPDDVVMRREHPEWVVDEWPPEVQALRGRDGRRMGQVHRWFLFDARRADITPTPDGSELTAWQWVAPQWLIDHVIEWKRPAYRRVLEAM